MQLWKYIFLTKESEALRVFSLPEHLTLLLLHAQPGSREGRRSSGGSPTSPPRTAPLTSTFLKVRFFICPRAAEGRECEFTGSVS